MCLKVLNSCSVSPRGYFDYRHQTRTTFVGCAATGFRKFPRMGEIETVIVVDEHSDNGEEANTRMSKGIESNVPEDSPHSQECRGNRGRKRNSPSDEEIGGPILTPRSKSEREKQATPATRTKKQAQSQPSHPGLITSFFKNGPSKQSSVVASNAEQVIVEKNNIVAGSEISTGALHQEKPNSSAVCNDQLFSENKTCGTAKENFPEIPLSHDGKIIGHIAAKLKDHQVIISLMRHPHS